MLGSLGVALLALAALAVVCLVAVRRSTLVPDASGLRHVGFGWPLPWLFQDQRQLDPAYPFHATFGSPWRSPVSVHLAALAADVLVVLVPLLLAALVIRRLRTDESEVT
jgi:hypothetical protein